jgi:hypothetical protein
MGFRLLGQRFTADSFIFQNLVYPRVKAYRGKSEPFTCVMSPRGPIRAFPRGLDIMAVLGSVRAEEIIREEGDDDYDNYGPLLQALKKEFATDKEEPNLYQRRLNCLKPLLSASAGPVPHFMHSKAWRDKSVQSLKPIAK